MSSFPWLTFPLELSQEPDLLPSSPSETSSESSIDPTTPITRPRSAPLHVVCNAPLVAPVPLPYHSPTFLHFDLPDIDQDLSRPPYIKQSLKRKRDSDERPHPPPKRNLPTRTHSTPPTPPITRRTKQLLPSTRHTKPRTRQRPF